MAISTAPMVCAKLNHCVCSTLVSPCAAYWLKKIGKTAAMMTVW